MNHDLKRVFVAVLSISGLLCSAALAQPFQPGPSAPPPGYDHPPGPPPPAWHNGGHYHGNRHYADWQHADLRPPPQGYQWVQADNPFLLIQLEQHPIRLNRRYNLIG